MSPRSSLYRAPAQCSGGHGFFRVLFSSATQIFVSLSRARDMLIITSFHNVISVGGFINKVLLSKYKCYLVTQPFC